MTDTYDMDTFGRELGSTGSTPNPYRYGAAWGYITDPSGFLQLGARFYWPEIGRFVSQDPIGDGVNWYAYVGNNPVVGVDPEGLWPCPQSPWYWLGQGETWGAGLTQGAKIVADKVDPFGAPYYNAGAYDTTDPLINAAQASAGVGVAAGTVAGVGTGLRALGVSARLLPTAGGFSIRVGNRLRLEWHRLPETIERWGGRFLPHIHRRGPGGIGRHWPWE